MALRKILAKRQSYIHKLAPPAAPISLPSPPPAEPNVRCEYLSSTDSNDKSFFRWFLHRRAIYQSAARLPEFLSIPVGDKLKEKLKNINITRDRLPFNELKAPAAETVTGERSSGVSVLDAKKLLRLTQLEKLKVRLREIPVSSISYSEFVQICGESCENEDRGVEFARMLDDAGNVIVFGNVVLLRPEQVAKQLESIILNSTAIPNDPRRKELAQMENLKSEIDKKAKDLVRGELYCGLGFLTLQTIGFIRLTFWELSWDVMEPICFFVTSLHFAAAYGFFLRTSTEPTFESYFQRRFKTKQKKLIKLFGFDVEKYNELRRVCYPHFYGVGKSVSFSELDCEEEPFLRAMDR